MEGDGRACRGGRRWQMAGSGSRKEDAAREEGVAGRCERGHVRRERQTGQSLSRAEGGRIELKAGLTGTGQERRFILVGLERKDSGRDGGERRGGEGEAGLGEHGGRMVEKERRWLLMGRQRLTTRWPSSFRGQKKRAKGVGDERWSWGRRAWSAGRGLKRPGAEAALRA